MSNVRHPRVAGLIALALLAAACDGTTPESDPILGTLAHGSEAEVASLLYGSDDLTPQAFQIGLRLVRELRAPSPEHELEYVAQRSAGRLRMLIVRAPWLQGTPHGTHRPILLLSDGARERIIGTVLPFNDLIPLLGEGILHEAAPLSAWYIESHGAS